MGAGYNEILKFLKNIYYAKARKLNEEYLEIWIREIRATDADILTL